MTRAASSTGSGVNRTAAPALDISTPAAEHASERTCLHVTLPAFGRINLGPPDQLTYRAGIATLTALEIIEWPVAVTIAAGHLLAEQRRHNALHSFGEALEQA